MREYTELGFRGIFTHNGIYSIGDDLVVEAMSDLHREIFLAICSCDVRPSSAMFRAMRLELDLSQKDLAERIEYSFGMIGKWECEEIEIPLLAIRAIKSMLLAKLDPTRSIGVFEMHMESRQPDEGKFEFEIDEGLWRWVNDDFRAKEVPQ